MVESAAHLVDNVLPLAPYRQFVLSFPMPLRYWFQTSGKLFSKVHGIVTSQIRKLYKTKALSQGIKNPITGSISYTQRFGSGLNLNPHIHALWLDGVFTEVGGNLKFQNVSPLDDDEVATLITTISGKVIGLLKKMEHVTLILVKVSEDTINFAQAGAIAQGAGRVIKNKGLERAGKVLETYTALFQFGPKTGTPV